MGLPDWVQSFSLGHNIVNPTEANINLGVGATARIAHPQSAICLTPSSCKKANTRRHLGKLKMAGLVSHCPVATFGAAITIIPIPAYLNAVNRRTTLVNDLDTG